MSIYLKVYVHVCGGAHCVMVINTGNRHSD